MVACFNCGFSPITSSMEFCPNCRAPAHMSFDFATHQIATNTAEHVLAGDDRSRDPPAVPYNPDGIAAETALYVLGDDKNKPPRRTRGPPAVQYNSNGGRRTNHRRSKRNRSLKHRRSKRNRSSKRRRPKGSRKKGNTSKRNKKRILKRGGGACQSGMCPPWINDIKEKMRKKYVDDFDERNLDQIIKDNTEPKANLDPSKFKKPTTQENMFREAMSQEPSYLLFKENMYHRKNQTSPFDDTHGPAQHDKIYYTPTPAYTPY